MSSGTRFTRWNGYWGILKCFWDFVTYYYLISIKIGQPIILTTQLTLGRSVKQYFLTTGMLAINITYFSSQFEITNNKRIENTKIKSSYIRILHEKIVAIFLMGLFFSHEKCSIHLQQWLTISDELNDSKVENSKLTRFFFLYINKQDNFRFLGIFNKQTFKTEVITSEIFFEFLVASFTIFVSHNNRRDVQWSFSSFLLVSKIRPNVHKIPYFYGEKREGKDREQNKNTSITKRNELYQFFIAYKRWK